MTADATSPDTRWRMGFHLMPPTGWLSDPNGLCQYQGTYHVFHQYSPDWPHGGERCWGHFESENLIHWRRLNVAIHQDIPEDANGACSGSALIEQDEDGEDRLMRLYYTGNVKEPGDYDYVHAGRQANQIEVTSEDGETLSAKRVLLANADYPEFCTCHVRDPKVWKQDDPAGAYHMLLGARDQEDFGRVLLFDSADGDAWSYRGSATSAHPFGYMWECPDRIELGGAEYLSFCPQGLNGGPGAFENAHASGYIPLPENGRILDAETLDEGSFIEWDHGFDFYAPQTFVDEDGRTILIGWMGVPDAEYDSAPDGLGWIHCLTVPRELRRAHDGHILQQPVDELAELHTFEVPVNPHAGALFQEHRADIELSGIEGGVTLRLDNALEFSYADGWAHLRFIGEGGEGAGRTERSAELDSLRDLRILVDDSAVEIYCDGGYVTFATRWFPHARSLLLTLACDCQSARGWGMADGMSDTYAR